MCFLNIVNLWLSLLCSQTPPPDTELRTNHFIHHALNTVELIYPKVFYSKSLQYDNEPYLPGDFFSMKLF